MKTNSYALLLLKIAVGYLLIIAGVVFRPAMYLATLYTIFAVLLEKESIIIICYLFAWLNVSTIFKFSVDGISVFTLLELLAISKILLKKRSIELRFFILWVLYVAYLMIGMGDAYTDLIKTAMMPLMLYSIVYQMNYSKLRTAATCYTLGVLVSSVLGLLRNAIPNLKEFIFYKSVNLSYSAGSGFETSLRFSGLLADPNYYSIHLILVMSISVIMYLRKELKPILFISIYVAILLFGAMTGSKSFLLMAAIVTMIFVFSLIKERQFSRFLVISILILVLLIMMYAGRIDVFSVVVQRIMNVNTGFSQTGMTTGRIDLWEIYGNMFSDNYIKFLVGNGIGVGHSYYRPPHNTIIDFLDIIGVLGTIIITAIVIRTYQITPREGRGSKIILLVAPMFLFLSMFYSFDFCFGIAMIFCFAKQGKLYYRGLNEDEEKKDNRTLQY